jgi:hypothetical protein
MRLAVQWRFQISVTRLLPRCQRLCVISLDPTYLLMRLLLPAILLTLIIACNETPKPQQADSAQTPRTDTIKPLTDTPIDSLPVITLGYADTYEKLPKLKFQSISANEFNALKPVNSFRKTASSEKDSIIYIQTNQKRIALRKYNPNKFTEGDNGYTYIGVNSSHHLFALSQYSLNEGFTFSHLVFIDSLTSYRYNIISFGDGGDAIPLTSSSGNYIVYYYNLMFDNLSHIGVLKINKDGKPEKHLSEYASGNFPGMKIEEIVWKLDSEFYVKGVRVKAGKVKENVMETPVYYRCVLE